MNGVHVLKCNMADKLLSTYDLEWLSINILDAAPDLTVTHERSQMIHAYLAGSAMESREHQVTQGQESRQTGLQQEATRLMQYIIFMQHLGTCRTVGLRQ
jgi:hypothetical protein